MTSATRMRWFAPSPRSAGRRGFRRCGSMRRTTSSSGPNWRAECTPPLPAPAGGPNSSMSPPFGDDGHSLFSRGISLWTPMVDSFLRDQNLGTRDIAAMPAPSPISPPPQLRDKGRAGFADYLSGEPAPGLCRLAKGSFRFPQRAPVDARSGGGCPHRLRGVRSPIARYMRSTTISRRPPTPDRAECFPDFRPAVPASTPRGRRGRRLP